MGDLHAAFRHRGPVDVQGDVSSFAESTTVVGELEHDPVLTDSNSCVGARLVLMDAEGVVDVAQVPVIEVDRPASEPPTLSHDDPGRACLAHIDLRLERPTLVLGIDDGVLRQSPHPSEQHLPIPMNQRRPPGQFWDEPFRCAVI